MVASSVERQASPPVDDPGSFRDPSGSVIRDGDRILRYFRGESAGDFRALMESGLLDDLVQQKLVIPTRAVGAAEIPTTDAIPADASLVVEHPRLPFVSYAYEWPFEMLKEAALSHLETLNQSLGGGYIVKDGTSYNMQFRGTKPIFIDVASFERYRDGDPWRGYSQFCRMFLNPLLFQALKGVPFQPWIRTSLEGIDPADLSRLLALRHKLRPSIFVNVVLQAWLTRRAANASLVLEEVGKRPVPEKTTRRMIRNLSNVISGLKRRKDGRSVWADYDDRLPYTAEALLHKERLVEAAVRRATPASVWDIGCNRGHYSLIAARHAGHVVAMDNDEATVGAAYESLRGDADNVLPLVMDLMNPSPDQGWAQQERQGLAARGPADFVLCLALVHHLAISGSVPLQRIVDWISNAGRAGVIEFVPKTDPMVQTLLRTRKDVYPDYTVDAFQDALESRFRIVEREAVRGSKRTLFTVAPR